MAGLRKDFKLSTIALFIIWFLTVASVVAVIVPTTLGKTILGRVVHFEILPIVMVIVLLVCDLSFRYLIYVSLQAVSLDVVLFALIARITFAFSGAGDGAVNAALLAALLVLSTLEFGVYRAFRKKYREALRKWLQPAVDSRSASLQRLIIQTAQETIPPDLWGLFERDQLDLLATLRN